MDYNKKAEQEFVEDTALDGRDDGKSSPIDQNGLTYDGRMVVPKTALDKQAALAAAQLEDPGIKALSLIGFQFGLIILCCCLCGSDTGMDGTVMSAINGMKQFQDYFGLSGKAASTGIIFGIYTLGGVTASIPASILPDKIGRRWPMFIANIVLITGALISANARSMGMLLGGRYLTGLGCATAGTCAKIYVSEITSPSNRGKCMGLLNSFYYIGQIIASGIAVPFGRHTDAWAWRAPLYVQVGPAFLNVLFVLLLPESPRYLYARGHKEKAVAILARLHSRTNDITSPLIRLEIEEIEEGISLDGADRRFWDVRKLFNTGAARYRAALCFLVSCGGQLSGNGLITYFLTILLRQAGITNQDRILTLNFVNSITSFAGALTGTAAVDYVGRRKLMLFGEGCACIGMAIVAGLLSPTGPQTQMRANAGISFIFLFMVFFSLGWTPLQGLYPTEILSFENRAKGLALQGLATNAVSCINTFGMPPALAKLGYKMYIVFAVFDAILFAIIYLFVVETKQLSLEEIDGVFEARHPVKHSLEIAKERRLRRKEENLANARNA